jgi:hypothetical protein
MEINYVDIPTPMPVFVDELKVGKKRRKIETSEKIMLNPLTNRYIDPSKRTAKKLERLNLNLKFSSSTPMSGENLGTDSGENLAMLPDSLSSTTMSSSSSLSMLSEASSTISKNQIQELFLQQKILKYHLSLKDDEIIALKRRVQSLEEKIETFLTNRSEIDVNDGSDLVSVNGDFYEFK